MTIDTGAPGGVPRAAGSAPRTGSPAGALRRHLPLVLAAAVAGAAVGGGLALRQERTFSSDSVVLVNPVVGAPFSPSSRGSAANLETEAQLVGTPALAAYAQRALREAGGDATAEQLRRSVSAQVPLSTQLLRITATADDADEARARATAYAEAFLTYRAERADDVAAQRLRTIQEQRAALEQQLTEATARAAAEGVSAGEQGLLAERTDLLTQQLARLDEQAGELADVAGAPGQVVTPATAPADGRARALATFAGAGALLGLLLGAVLALLRDRRDERVHAASELDAAGVRVLAHLPASRAGAGPVLLDAPDGEAAQAVRRVRTGVLVAPGTAPRTVAVSAVGAATGGSAGRPPAAAVLAADLAVALARTGERTVLVDADPAPGARAGRLLGVQDAPGLSEVLVEQRSAASLLQASAVPALSVLPAGADPAAAADRLVSDAMRREVAGLVAAAPYVVLSAAPASSADGEAVAALADATVLVVELGRTTWPELEAARRELDRLGARVLGVVAVPRAGRPGRPGGARGRRAGAPAAGTPGAPDPELPVGEDAAAQDRVSAPR